MKKGDIFRWSYTPEEIEKRADSLISGTLYWCCSNIAIFNGEHLVDTYWNDDNHSKRWTEQQAHEKLVLQFIANMNELEPITYHIKYYEPCNIVDLTHSNSYHRQVFLKRGATKDRETMLTYVNTMRLTAIQNLKCAKQDITWYEEKMKEIESTNDLSNITI